MALGFIGLAMLGYQKRINREQPDMAILYLLVGGFGCLLCHVFSLLIWGVLMLTEASRTLLRRTFDWPLILAMVVPLSSLVFYAPLLQTHSTSAFPSAFQPNINIIIGCYLLLIVRLATILIPAILVLRILLGKSLFNQMNGWREHAAFFFRYCFSGYLAIPFLIAAVLYRWTGGNRIAAVVCALFLLLGVFYLKMGFASGISPAQRIDLSGFLSADWRKLDHCQACVLADQVAPDLPFVDASGLTFLEMDSRRDSAFLSRVYYLTDPIASLQYAHATIFDAMQSEKENFPIRANVASYESFVHQHHKFLVYGQYNYPEDWLLRKLLADGAQLRFLGYVEGSYKDHELWEITLKADAP
jgi:hypothetical protein